MTHADRVAKLRKEWAEVQEQLDANINEQKELDDERAALNDKETM